MARRLGFMAEADLAAGRDPGQKRKYIGITNKNNAGRIMFNGRVNLDETALDEPLRWKKPRRVFVNSMSDLFHKDVPYEFIRKVWMNMLSTPQHTYQVLTKRPERMAEVVAQLREEDWRAGLPKPFNIWLGTSVENQEQADARIPHLLVTPAHVRFLSCEPLLGPVELMRANPDPNYFRRSWLEYNQRVNDGKFSELTYNRIDWVIAGGESGPGARPMHPSWARSLRDQCAAAGVAFFFKQWGEWLPFERGRDEQGQGRYLGSNGQNVEIDTLMRHAHEVREDLGIVRLGKHAAGRLLDGREWNEFPQVLR